MISTNTEFFNEYKRLDKLCSEIYGVNNGISSYIDAMDSMECYKVKRITDWVDTLRKLKHFRYIRNEIAHGGIDIDGNLCDFEDIDWIKDFYQRIIEGNDPLSLVRKQSVSSGKKNSNVQNKVVSDRKYQVGSPSSMKDLIKQTFGDTDFDNRPSVADNSPKIKSDTFRKYEISDYYSQPERRKETVYKETYSEKNQTVNSRTESNHKKEDKSEKRKTRVLVSIIVVAAIIILLLCLLNLGLAFQLYKWRK